MADRTQERHGGWDPGRSSDWVRHAIFYGIDVARFHASDGAEGTQTGDLAGLTQKLDYLHDLGATCLWLLPFYPSQRRDNGYAVTDYLGVDPRFGDLDDFRELTVQAHARGIRIMIDLVIHHTSSKHPWFQAAEADPSSRYADYYVWSKQQPDDDESQSVFPEEEHGIWSYSERAEAYYRHKFYDFQPDLNLNNEAVWESVMGVIDFWIAMGVDGFRVDAATLMFTDPKPGEPTFESRFDELRAYLERRAPYIALLGEADVAPDDLRRYFDGGRFDVLYDFLANNALYLSLVRESATPLAATLERLREVTDGSCLLNFVRNVDELDLEQLTDAERDEVFRTLAPEPDMRIYGRGIRRGWAPMMRNRQQLAMSMSLLFALPGVPLLMYGQEAAIGDDLSKGGRDAVRLPMPWHGDAELTALTTRLADLRAAHPGIGDQGWQSIESDDALLVLRYGGVVCVHNLSADERRLPRLDVKEPLLGADLSDESIPAYGFGWATA